MTPSMVKAPANHTSCICEMEVAVSTGTHAAASCGELKSIVAVTVTDPGVTASERPVGALPKDAKCWVRPLPNAIWSKSLTSPPTVNVTSTPLT